MAYLTGPNSAAMMPNSASATNSSGTECRKKPRAAKIAAKISANFSRRATTDFTNLSASSPPRPERMKNGKMKTAPATVTSASPWPATAPYNRIMTSAFFKTLSFSAEQNCAQNNGAKRRDDINCMIMIGPVYFRQPAIAIGAGELQQTTGGIQNGALTPTSSGSRGA